MILSSQIEESKALPLYNFEAFSKSNSKLNLKLRDTVIEKKRVLIIDDNSYNILALKLLLT